MSSPATRVVPLVLAAMFLAACMETTPTSMERAVAGGDPERGAAALVGYGCGSCHAIPGIAGADGEVGPALDDLAHRQVIAGKLANEPRNLIHWIRAPQAVDPGNAMPDLGVSEQDARDIAAYLYQLGR